MSEELKNSPIEDFDWDAFEKGEKISIGMPLKKAKLKERNLTRNWYTPTTNLLTPLRTRM